MIKILRKLGIQGNASFSIKTTFKKPRPSVIFNDERLSILLLSIRNKVKNLCSQHSLNTVPEASDNAIWQEKCKAYMSEKKK